MWFIRRQNKVVNLDQGWLDWYPMSIGFEGGRTVGSFQNTWAEYDPSYRDSKNKGPCFLQTPSHAPRLGLLWKNFEAQGVVGLAFKPSRCYLATDFISFEEQMSYKPCWG